MRKIFLAAKLLKIAAHLIITKDKRAEKREFKALISKSPNRKVRALHKLLLPVYTHPPQRVDKEAVLAKVAQMEGSTLEDLKKDMPLWEMDQKFLLEELLREAKEVDQIALFARFFYADQWLLTTDNPTLNELYFPIFLFSTLKFKAIDYTYREAVLQKMQTLSTKEIQLLKDDVVHWARFQQRELGRIIGKGTAFDNLFKHLVQLEAAEDFTTTSSNPNVLAVYYTVISNERSGFAYEQDYLSHIYVWEDFTAKDWKELQEDLTHWKNDHLDAFTCGVVELDFPTENRLELLITLLKIGTERNNKGSYNDINSTILEDEHALNAYLLDLLNQQPNKLDSVKEFLLLLYAEEYTSMFLKVKEKIKELEEGL